MSKITGAPNDKARTARTAKAGKCQWCQTKVPIEDQYTVVNDLDEGVVVAKKIGKQRASTVIENAQSHWCDDCKGKRVKMAQRWLDRRAGKPAAAKPKKAAAKPKAKAKPAKKASASAAKPAAKPARKPAKKAKRPAKAAAAAGSSSDPF